jgi:spoIIIJ-associated protein
MISTPDITSVLAELFEKLGLTITPEVDQDGEVVLINLSGKDVKFLDPEKDNRLGALVTIVKLILKQKFGVEPKIVFDINNQRKQRLDNVAKMARKMAEMVRVKGVEEELPPMTPAERRAVHMELKEMSGIKTESRGVEPHRRIVIVVDE